MKKTKFGILFLIICGLFACKSTKFVPEGEYLLNHVWITVDTKDVSREELRGYLRQTPNSAVLGLVKLDLAIYNLSGRDSTKWLNRFVRNLGHPPEIYDPSQTAFSRQQLEMAMHNRGFFNANVKDSVIYKNKKSSVIYSIVANKPYRLRNYASDLPDSLLTVIATDTVRSLMRKNMLFDTDVLNNERIRIEARYRQNGYYRFTKDALAYLADSTLNTNQIDLTVGLNEGIANLSDSVRQKLFQQYRIRNVIFRVNKEFSLQNADSLPVVKNDTLNRNGYIYITPKKQFLRFNTLIFNTSIVPGQLYSVSSVERTNSSLNSIAAIRYIELNFSIVGDSLLDCNIYLTPAKEVNFTAEPEMTLTGGSYWGISGNVSTQHKNLFRGAELFTLRGRVTVERQRNIWAQEYGGQIGLRFPNFMMPFISTEIKRRIRAKTEFSTSINYQFRPSEYTTMKIGGTFKYLWNLQQSRSTLELIDISYVDFPKIALNFYETFLESGTYNRYNYQEHLIMRIAYSNAYSSFSASRPLRNFYSYSWNVETAGNVLYGISKIFNLPQSEDKSYHIFNIRFAQYVKGYFSTSYNQIFDKNNRIVYRAALGLATPYGNADIIPYERRFFSGGANSVRGWSENTLGPGSYRRITSYGRRDYNQNGDIKLDLNMEVRSKMFWVLEGALFFDAGNVWTVRDYPEQPGGMFHFNNFASQIALAYGVGLRADFSFFLARIDLGVKLYNPALEHHQAWRTSPSLREDAALHIAIGYPF